MARHSITKYVAMSLPFRNDNFENKISYQIITIYWMKFRFQSLYSTLATHPTSIPT